MQFFLPTRARKERRGRERAEKVRLCRFESKARGTVETVPLVTTIQKRATEVESRLDRDRVGGGFRRAPPAYVTAGR
jgi:hypothetical protein